MPWKLMITRQPPKNVHAEVFVDENTFWNMVSRRTSLSTEWFKENIHVKSKEKTDMNDIAHLVKLVRVVFETLVRKGIDITEVTRDTGEKDSSDVETFLNLAQKAVNQEIDLSKLFSDYEARRIGILRVCYASDEMKFMHPDWLKLYTQGMFTEAAVEDGLVADNLFCFALQEV